MMDIAFLRLVGDLFLVGPFALILLASIYLTIKTGFIQIRTISRMIGLLKSSLLGNSRDSSDSSLPPHKALFAAMSTTIGIGNIVGPAVAIRLGGPGALVGFLMAIFFGAAMTYAEVVYALHYRKKNDNGDYVGGPMYYLQAAMGKSVAILYAIAGALLLVVWCSNQSNTLADILCTYSIPKPLTGGFVALCVVIYLVLGIKHIGNLAGKLVPIMFFIYCGASLFIIALHIEKLPEIISLVFKSAFSLHALSGAAVGSMLRWGLAKGIQASEAGIGTATILHVQADVISAETQGILSMVSIYSVALVCTLSGLVTLVMGTWNDPATMLGISMIAKPFGQHFGAGKIILAISVFLFAFGTILGNAYNGSKCFLYLMKESAYSLYVYYGAVALVVFFGAILDVELIWTISDFFIIPVALPNVIGIMYLTFKHPDLL